MILLGASRGHHSVRLNQLALQHRDIFPLLPFSLFAPRRCTAATRSPAVARDPCVPARGALLISAVGLELVPMPIQSGGAELPGMRAQPARAVCARDDKKESF